MPYVAEGACGRRWAASDVIRYAAPAQLVAATVLSAYADTAGHWITVVRPIGVVVIIAVGITAVASRVLGRSGVEVAVASAASLALTGAILAIAIVGFAALWAMAAWYVARKGRRLEFPTVGFGAFSALVFGIALASAATALVGTDLRLHPPPKPGEGRSSPSIYVLLLDGYPRADTLLAEFDYDNGAFTAALQERDFAYYPDALSPASRTELTLLAMLGTDVDADAIPAWTPKASERRAVRDAIQQAPATPALRDAGYHLVHLASPIAHTNFAGWDEVLDSGHINEFEVALLNRSPLARVLSAWVLDQQRARIEETLATFAAVARSDRQQVVLAHVMAPHPPFVYGLGPRCYITRDCSLYDVRPAVLQMTEGEYARAFAAQLDAINALVVETLDRVIAADSKATIVVLGDHGARHDEALSQEWRRSLLAVRGSDALNDEHSAANLFLRLLEQLPK